MAGLDENGFEAKRLPEVVADIETQERINIDSNISTEPDEVLGQLNTTIGASIAEQWALGQAVYDAFNPLTAEGVQLDNLAALIGISRIAGTPSSTDRQLFTGDDGVVVIGGSIINNPINSDRFLVTQNVALTVGTCYSSKYSVKEILDTTLYTLTINGNLISYTSDGTATELEILNGLKADNDSSYPSAVWSVVVDTIGLQLDISSNDTATTITISSITYISADEVSVYGEAESEEVSSIIAPSNSVTGIVTGISGWTSTTNTSAYIVGREEETDEELRERLLTSQQASGRGTVEAIQDSVANVVGVSSAVVTENELSVFSGGSEVVTFTNASDLINWTAHPLEIGTGVKFNSSQTLPLEIQEGIQYWVVVINANSFQISETFGGSVLPFTDDGSGIQKVLVGLPPKSFETVVQGGDNDDVALEIWNSKPAGIETFGTSTVTTPDDDGVSRTVKFTRPSGTACNFEVEYELDPEGTAPTPSEISDDIKAIVTAQTSTLDIGEDVIPSRYYSSIYAGVEGIIVTLIQVEDAANPGFVTDRLPIGSDSFATTTTGDVIVTQV